MTPSPILSHTARHRLVGDWVISVIEYRFGLEDGVIRSSERGNMTIIQARQLCAYFLSTSCGFSQRAIAALVSRHYTTVGHALRQVELNRDDPVLDASLEAVERSLSPLLALMQGEVFRA